jgi:hypothetical protein
LALETYGDWTQYQKIVDANPQFASRPLHSDGRWSPPVVTPILYAGDKVRVPIEPKLAMPNPQEPESHPAKPIRKDRWTGVEHQAPTPKLEIFKPENKDDQEADITYSAGLQGGAWSNLLGYSFSEAVDDLEGSFSFTVENEEVDAEGKTVFDLIPNRSVVKIYEGGERPAFAGIIRSRRMGASMTSQGVKRTITFTGKSIISCITEYTVSLDMRIPDVPDPTALTRTLESDLAHDGLTIKGFMKESWDYFKKVSENTGISTTGLSEIIRIHIGDADKFITVLGKEQELRYNIVAVFFNAANNMIADVWRNILPKPVYELFSRCDGGEPKIIARQVPYGDPDNGNNDWKELPIYIISPISLTAYDLEQSDEEVYTAFASYIIGSAMDRMFYMGASQGGKDSNVQRDVEKQAIYGFKPLEITFNGYDRQFNTNDEKIDTLTKAVQKLNKLAAYWFSRLDDMYSGSITICTDFNAPETNPRAGCRAKFLGGEFYINKADHTWTYGGTPTIKLTISRGLMYDENGKIRLDKDDKTSGVIPNVGRSFRELELENA